MKAKTQAPSITTGPVTGQLSLFFSPIPLGIFFQQLYDTVGTVIVGSFVGTNTVLATIGGATDQLMNLSIGLFVGLSSGYGIIISRYYGARDRSAVSKSVHTVLTSSLVSGVMVMMPGLALIRFSLHAMSLPSEIIPETSAYLHIYFLGMIPNLSYNMGAAVLRAIDDSGHPLYSLILGCLSNVMLGLVFMVSLRMGVADTALATILSQTASAIMILYTLLHTDSEMRLNPWELHTDLDWLKKTIHIGLPTGLQSIIYTISNIIVQATVSSFGTNTVVTTATYDKMDVPFQMAINTSGIAITTFVGQNYNAGRVKRASQGFRVSFMFSIFATLFLSTVIWFSDMDFLHFFTKDPAIFTICRRLIHCVVPFFITYIPIGLYSSTLHSMGNNWMSVIMIMISACVLRLFQVSLAVPLHRNILTLMTAYPTSWITTSVALSLYLFLTRHHHHPKNLVRQDEKSTAA